MTPAIVATKYASCGSISSRLTTVGEAARAMLNAKTPAQKHACAMIDCLAWKRTNRFSGGSATLNRTDATSPMNGRKQAIAAKCGCTPYCAVTDDMTGRGGATAGGPGSCWKAVCASGGL